MTQKHSKIAVQVTPAEKNVLSWPRDARQIARLSIPAFQTWLAGIDPRELIFLAQNRDFERFLFWHYLLPVRFYRFLIKIKNMFRRIAHG